jgi:hypothetical protein
MRVARTPGVATAFLEPDKRSRLKDTSRAERTAAASFTSVPRSLAASLSPALAGALFSSSWNASPLILCGALKIAYDLLLLHQFRRLKPPEER